MSGITGHVVAYCAQECAWQNSGELSVAWMVDGWRYAHRHRSKPIKVRDILALGSIVEPRLNQAGLRRSGVRVGWDIKMDWQYVPDALNALVARQPPIGECTEAEATEWFRQYEEIHPFRDGNGRTGTLLYNWLRGSLPEPVHAPNLWDDPRREPHTPERGLPPSDWGEPITFAGAEAAQARFIQLRTRPGAAGRVAAISAEMTRTGS